MEEVILVDKNDQQIGILEKLEAHKKGLLHRAFSVLLFNDKGEMLIQKRAPTKYHSANLWSNACCSHPKPNESIIDAAVRRLSEELGVFCIPKWSHSFIYKATFSNGLTENELDHVLLGVYEGKFEVNIDEASEIRFINIDDLKQELLFKPESFTIWFKLILDQLLKNPEKLNQFFLKSSLSK